MSSGRLAVRDLFDPEFIESVQRLQILARRVARGGVHAEQRSRDMGSGIEFRDFRPYTPGDDFRSIDWNIYRRLGKVFLRLFEELEDFPVYLLPDVSESLWVEEPPRARAGLRAALGLAAIALQQHDRVGIFPWAEELRTAVRPMGGKGRLLQFARALAEVEPGGPTRTAVALERFAAMNLREGLVVVISDFFDPAGVEAVTGALSRLRHRLLLVQLVRKTDLEPDIEGDVELEDCESGAVEEISATPEVIAAYKAAHSRFDAALRDFARRRGSGLLRLDADEEIVPQLASLFESGSFRP